jgi:hypothetical protein
MNGDIMYVVNMFAGPGTGKSTTANGLMYLLKTQHFKCELISEYAKDLTYSESFFKLQDQLYIFSKQHHKQWVVKDKVDILITDSPILLSLCYFPENSVYNKNIFTQMVLSTFNSAEYKNINFFLERNLEDFGYQQYGRNHSLEQAIDIDNKILNILDIYSVPYTRVKISEDILPKILNKVLDVIGYNTQNGEK